MEISLILQRWLSFQRRSEHVQLALCRWTHANSCSSLDALWRLSWIYHPKLGVLLMQLHGCHLTQSRDQACSPQTHTEQLKAAKTPVAQIWTCLWNLQCLSFKLGLLEQKWHSAPLVFIQTNLKHTDFNQGFEMEVSFSNWVSYITYTCNPWGRDIPW